MAQTPVPNRRDYRVNEVINQQASSDDHYQEELKHPRPHDYAETTAAIRSIWIRHLALCGRSFEPLSVASPTVFLHPTN